METKSRSLSLCAGNSSRSCAAGAHALPIWFQFILRKFISRAERLFYENAAPGTIVARRWRRKEEINALAALALNLSKQPCIAHAARLGIQGGADERAISARRYKTSATLEFVVVSLSLRLPRLARYWDFFLCAKVMCFRLAFAPRAFRFPAFIIILLSVQTKAS